MEAYSARETIVEADLTDKQHAAALVELLDAYAREPAGGGRPLPDAVRKALPGRLKARSDALVLIAFAGAEPAGLAVCFEGFSTFACAPLLNVHDLVVAPGHRGRGIAGRLLAQAEALARLRGCCKLTLEVLEGNHGARSVYERCGFRPYQLDPAMGHSLFWEKKLGDRGSPSGGGTLS